MFAPNRSPGSRRWALVRMAYPLVRIRDGIIGGAFRQLPFIGYSYGSESRHDLRHRSVRVEVEGCALAGLPSRTVGELVGFASLFSPKGRYV
jgi:hypothetical protein